MSCNSCFHFKVITWSGYLPRPFSSVELCTHETFDLLLRLSLLFTGQILQQGFYAWKSPLELTACFAKFTGLQYTVSFSSKCYTHRIIIYIWTSFYNRKIQAFHALYQTHYAA